MKDGERVENQVTDEIKQLRQRIAELEALETERKLAEQRIEELNHLKEDLLSPGSLNKKLNLITEGVVSIFDADFCRIWITKPGDLCDFSCIHSNLKTGPHVCRYRELCLHLVSSSGRYTHTDGEVHKRVPFGCYKIGLVAAGDIPKYIINDVASDPRVHNRDWAKELGLVSFAGYRLLSETGNPIGVLALFSKHTISPEEDMLIESLADTTAQVIQTAQAEQALQESEANLRTLFDSIKDLLFVLDMERRILHINAVVTERLGYSEEELLGKSVLGVHPSNRRDEALAIISDVIAGNANSCSVPLMTKDGILIPVETRVTRGKWDGQDALFGVCRDVSERSLNENLARIQRDLGVSLSNIADLDVGLSLCLEAAIQASEMECGGIYLVDKDTGSLDMVLQKGLSDDFAASASHYDADSPQTSLVMQGKPIYTIHIKMGVPIDKQRQREGLRAIAIIPVHYEDQVIACLNVSSRKLDEVSDFARSALEMIASQIGSAIVRLQTAEALRESEELLDNILLASAVGIAHAVDRKIVWANESIVEMFGFTKADQYVDQDTAILYSSAEEYRRVGNAVYEQQKTGRTMELDTRFKRHDGTLFDGYVKVNSLDQHDSTKGVLVSIIDITKRKQIENELRDSQNMLKTILQNMPGGVLLIDENYRICQVNNRTCEITGYSEKEIVGQLCDIICPKGFSSKKCPIWSGGKDGFTGMDTAVKCKDGGENPILKNAQRIIVNDKMYILENFQDISARKQAEQALVESESRFRELAEMLPEVIFETDTNLNLTYANQHAFELFRYSVEDFEQGLNGLDMIELKDRDRVKDNLARRMRGEELGTLEYQALRRDGSTFPMLFRASPIVKEAELFGFRGVVIDISERKRIEEELQKIEKLESIGVLAGGIAHDLNNFLTGIVGNISLAMMYDDSREKDMRLAEAEKACMQVKDLTHQLLTFSKGGAPILQTAKIGDLLRDSANFTLRGSNAVCEFDIPDDLWPTEIDENQMGQVINNLIINSQQAMPGGGVITISTKNVEVDKASGLPLEPGVYIKLSIKDRGTGIPADHLQRIFDPFFTTKQAGNGLGLATCYSIIEKHSGYIAVESQMGVGTTFHIYLPASPNGTAVEARAMKKKLVMGEGKILVMDDEKHVRDTAASMLSGLGYEVITAIDGTEAIEIYKEAMVSDKPFGAVIMDLTIPGGMGGKEAIQKLMEIDQAAKAIVSSGYSSDPVLSNFRKYGFMGFIPKPYKMQELSEVLGEAMEVS